MQAIFKRFSKRIRDITRKSVVPKFSDLQVIALSLTAETLSIDSENNLFNRLTGYKASVPNIISRRQFNDRRKFTGELCETIRKRIADCNDGEEEYFCIDSKPIEVCRIAQGKRCKMRKMDYSKAPSFGYCASQDTYQIPPVPVSCPAKSYVDDSCYNLYATTLF